MKATTERFRGALISDVSQFSLIGLIVEKRRKIMSGPASKAKNFRRKQNMFDLPLPVHVFYDSISGIYGSPKNAMAGAIKLAHRGARGS